ncbi:MAG: tripartite tricarboxylate transporter substrate binding protein [Betaproteobacteria bacterium]|nr:tripartite tricarboxylate transporter substrate binding protein [Betaproteobacteria bacterium]
MRRLLAVALLVIALPAALPVLAQSYPSKPIRFIVGFPPGGSADPTARLIGAALAEQLNQSVVIENRPGGDSAIGAEYVARQAPDGYTIFFGSNSAMTAAVSLRKTPLYDPLKDFTPIALVGRATFFFHVHPDVPAKSLQEFISYARANQGKLNYGTGNPLSILAMAQFMNATGVQMVHVPYKGEGPLTPDLIAGRVQATILSNPAGIQLAKDGRLRVLGVLADRRSAVLPDVPTFVEAGVPQVTIRQWAGVYGPAKMPREIVERLSKALNAVVKRQDVIERMQSYGYVADSSTPQQLLEINRDDLALWRKLIAEAGIALD